MSEPDVAIVGGGVAGAVLALGLAQRGRSVLVLERDAAPALNGADVVKPAGIVVLRALGVLPELMALGRCRDRLEVFYDAEWVASLDYRDRSADDFFLLVPYATVLQTVRAALERLPNVEYRCSSPVAELRREGDVVTKLQLESGIDVRARFYVGADGARSLVRARLGLDGERTTYDQKLFFGKFPLASSVDERNRLHVDSAGAFAYFYPIGTSAMRAVLGFSSAEAAELAAAGGAQLQARLRAFVSKSRDAVDKLDGLSAFAQIPVSKMHSALYGRGNVALIGDAIHSVHPITGQGMNLGIEDAWALTERLARMFDEHGSPADCIAGYQHDRFAVNQTVVEYGHRLASSIGDKTAFVANFDRQMQASRRRGPEAGPPRLNARAG